MKHKVIVSAGSQVFELLGEITEIDAEHIYMTAKDGDLYVDRRYVVFVQFLKEEVVRPNPVQPSPTVLRDNKVADAERLLKARLREDPLKAKLEQKLVPLSQLSDDVPEEEMISPTPNHSLFRDEPIYEEQPEPEFYQPEDPDDAEVMRQVGYPMVTGKGLKDAVKAVMSNEEVDLNCGGPGYKDPLKTILGLNKCKQRPE